MKLKKKKCNVNFYNVDNGNGGKRSNEKENEQKYLNLINVHNNIVNNKKKMIYRVNKYS